MIKMSIDDRARFWSKIQLGEDDECWPWMASRHRRGYGTFGYEGRTMIAPRLAWELEHGQDMGKLYACHTCDNPPCCNPAHIFPGTQKENMADMDAKGRRNTAPGDRNGSRKHPERRPKGPFHWKAKLTSEKVATIRQLRACGHTSKSLALRYSVSQCTIIQICNGRIWQIEEAGWVKKE